ncbi:MAG: FAD-binding protein [Deltaproteobacteria bacterium]|nr:FAD-binding protein [Deltaproteobacteria bacterium]
MIPQRSIEEISAIVGPAHLSTREENLAHYGTDGTKQCFLPDAVAFPGTAEEISHILRLANRDDFPVIPRGAGSGKSGGALPVRGGLVLAMERLDRILVVDPHNFVARVEPGVITAHLQREVENLGLFYPPDPASIHISTIGGNVAHCAGGLRAVKYGVTRDYVLGLTVVLPTGEIIRTGVETVKGVVGYDLTRLIVGSEGTLAVITSITLRLIPKPACTRTMVAFFRDASHTVSAVSRILRNRIVPTALEFMDRLCMDCVKEEIGLSIPPDSGAMLLIEVDGEEQPTAGEAEKIREVCLRGGATQFLAASGQQEAERLWEARRNVSPSVYRLRPDKVSEDIVVPRTRLPELVFFLEELGESSGLPVPAYGHAGDGNIHVNIMFDPENPEERARVEPTVRSLFRKVLEMGGTLSGEHGVGLTKAPYVGMEISSSSLQLMARIKKAFDPKGILNPGKILPQST